MAVDTELFSSRDTTLPKDPVAKAAKMAKRTNMLKYQDERQDWC